MAEPLDSFAVFPQAELLSVFRGDLVDSQPVLFAMVPVAFVLTTVLPSVYAKSMFLVIKILSVVGPTIIPLINTHALHIVVLPLALVASAVQPGVDTDTEDFVFKPLTLVF